MLPRFWEMSSAVILMGASSSGRRGILRSADLAMQDASMQSSGRMPHQEG